MFRIAALGVLLTTACVLATAKPPATAGVTGIEPPGACIYKVTIENGWLTVLYNPMPCPLKVTSWRKKDVRLPKDVCGVDIGSDVGDTDVTINSIPCKEPPPTTGKRS